MNTEIEKILHVAYAIFKDADFLSIVNADTPSADQRSSGYLCITENRSDETPPLAHCMFGIIKEEKKSRYFTRSLEKARRLQSIETSKSSWETRNIEEDKFGGAIRTTNFIISFSGLPELGDEAFVLFVAHVCGLISESEIQEISMLSGSYPIYKELEDTIQI